MYIVYTGGQGAEWGEGAGGEGQSGGGAVVLGSFASECRCEG